MQDLEVQQILLEIVDYAMTTKLSEFRFIRNWDSYCFYKDRKSYYKVLIKILSKSCNTLFKNYCKDILLGEGNFNTLLAYQLLQRTILFYQQELATGIDMLDEYKAYLSKGNLIAALSGQWRENYNMRDFRE